MKLIKLTLLAATAAVAAMSFIGASSALATPPWIALCDAPQLLNCEVKHLIKHPLLGRVLLLAGPGKFNAGFVNVECTSGAGKTNEVESQQETNFKATLESLTFAGCKGCTGVAVTTPQATVLNMETPETESWRLKAENSKVKFSGCPFGVSCTYKGNLNFKVQMDEEGAFADPEGAEFTLAEGGGLCAAKGKWETGRTRVDWELNDVKRSIHKKIWPSLIAKLTVATGVEL